MPDQDNGAHDATIRDRLSTSLRHHVEFWLFVLCGAAFVLTYRAPVDASFSDPQETLLTAQALVEHGTIRLDRYVLDERYLYNPIEPAPNGHSYNYFPIGPSLLAVPPVWLARLRGDNMLYAADNRALQNVLSSWSVVVCALLIFALVQSYLPATWALGLTSAFVFGTPVTSTLGTAYWSANSALVLGLGCVLILAMSDRGGIGRWTEALLGALLFLAYLCRPTMALLVPVAGLYLTVRWRRAPVVFATTVAGLLCVFVLFSWREFGTPLPPYYQPDRLGSSRFWAALYGQLLSPSRGVLVGSPFFVLTLLGLACWWRTLLRHGLAVMSAAWLLLHWVAIASFHHWWGGWSFGNRLFTDALPAAFLLTILVVRRARDALSVRAQRVAITACVIGAAFSVFVHTHQGLYNPYTVMWNDGIDINEARVFDWRNPQFLASPEALGLHARDHALLAMEPYVIGEPILPTSDTVVFEGWAVPEGDGAWRWSTSTEPSVLLRLDESRPGDQDVTLAIRVGTYGPQEATVRVNGLVVGVIHSAIDWEPSTYEMRVTAEALERSRAPQPGARILRIDFEIPGATLVGDGPRQRQLGLCLRRITVTRATGN